MLKPLEREWLHIQIIEGELYVFTDDGHWKNTPGIGGKADWECAKEFTLNDLDGECFLGETNNHNTLFIRIRMNRKVLYGKFGMPYYEKV